MILIAKIHRPQDKKSPHIRNNQNLITINDGGPSKAFKDFDPLESL
jgi:hypothetical protein